MNAVAFSGSIAYSGQSFLPNGVIVAPFAEVNKDSVIQLEIENNLVSDYRCVECGSFEFFDEGQKLSTWVCIFCNKVNHRRTVNVESLIKAGVLELLSPIDLGQGNSSGFNLVLILDLNLSCSQLNDIFESFKDVLNTIGKDKLMWVSLITFGRTTQVYKFNAGKQILFRCCLAVVANVFLS